MRQSKKQQTSSKVSVATQSQPSNLQAPDLSPAVLTPVQVAKLLQVKPSWVYEQTRSRAGVRNPDPLPFIRLGRYLRFDHNDVQAWLERQKNGNGKR